MRYYLNAGFGEPIGASDLALIKSLGFHGVRQDVLHWTQGSLVDEIAQANLAAILVLGPEVWSAPAERIKDLAEHVFRMTLDVAFEVGNELDGRVSPREYGQTFAKVEAGIRSLAPDATVITAGIRDCGHGPLGWLRDVISTGLISEQACIGYHTYRATPPGVPREGYRKREDEFDALRLVARGRPLWHTEIGWSTAPRKAGGCAGLFGKRWSYNDEQVAEFLDYELRVNRDQGAESFTVFQLSDGPKNENEGRFGIRTLDGVLKHSAHVVGRYA